MPRRMLHKVLPSHTQVRRQWFLRPFRALLSDPALWATHRRNTLRAMAVGLFISFIPFPIHTVLAGVVALYLRVNIPVAIVASWMSNPLTFGPIYYGCYVLGRVLLGEAPDGEPGSFSMDSMGEHLAEIWEPLLLGCLVAATVTTAVSYWALNRLWIRHVRRQFHRRSLDPARQSGK